MQELTKGLYNLEPDKKEVVDIFLKLINRNKHSDTIKNIAESLESYFVIGIVKDFGNVRNKLANNFIHYCNLIFTTLDIDTFEENENALSHVFKAVFEKNNNIRYPQGFLNLYNDANNPNFDNMPTPFKFCKVLLDLRNAYNHPKLGDETVIIKYKNGKDKDLTNSEFYVADVNACLHTYLYVTEVYLRDLKSSFEKETEYDFTNYLEKVKGHFLHKFKKYVNIRAEEDVKLTRNIKENKTDFSANAPETIKGTIEELRNNNKKIPKKRMIIWADAGMGKSTTLEYLAYTDANQKLNKKSDKLPVFLEMGLLIEGNKTMIDYIWQKINDSTHIDKSYVLNALENGKINLFIDALNEIPNDLQQQRQKEIQNLCDTYPKTYIIISTRQSHNPFANIPKFILQKMNDNELQEFLKKNTEGKAEVARIIQDAIEKEDFLKEACRQYFMFSRLIEAVAQTRKLPDSEMDIVTMYLDSICEREYQEKKDIRFGETERKYINYLLAELAYNIYMELGDGNPLFKESDAMQYFRNCMKENGFSINLISILDIITQLNILEKVYVEEEEKYRFFHGNYQSYFSSYYLKLHN